MNDAPKLPATDTGVVDPAPSCKRRKKNHVSHTTQRVEATKTNAKEWIRDISKHAVYNNDFIYQFTAEHTPSPLLLGQVEIKPCTPHGPLPAVILSTPLRYWSTTTGPHEFPVKYSCSTCNSVLEPGPVHVLFNPVLSLPFIVMCNTCIQ